ncbi:MAG: winged helix-turn-helix domain-containing protein [Burkholderiales bacterium]|nr:winged helix-turn-helix domain-containing protein [Burkholderiales bacterium]
MAAALDADFAATAQRYLVGGWTVEPTLHRISAGGRTTRLEPKAMAVLLRLAARPGEVVSRDELLAEVWPGLVVGDDALTQVVVKLRRALGDTSRRPAYIETIAKGGYRLVAPVRPAAADPSAQQSAHPTPRTGLRPRRPMAAQAVSALAGLLVAMIAAAWLLAPRGDASDRPPAEASVGSLQPTVTIDPIEPIGDDPRASLLARAVTADLVNDLSKVAGLWVVARGPGSAATGAASEAAPTGPRYRVGGSAQLLGERLRLQLELAEEPSGRLLWSQRFEQPWAGLLDVQAELAPAILRLLPARIDDAELRRVARRYTRSLDAWEAFQLARAALHLRRQADNETARAGFRRAIELDPGFARAYAGLAMSHVADFRYQWVADRGASLDRAYELARSAHEIDPDLAETHWTLAFVHVHRSEHDEALRILQRAVRLYPSFADAHALMGGIFSSTGRADEGIALLRRAIRLAPESGYLYHMLLGRAYLFVGDLEQARINLRESLARNPEFLDARVYLAVVHLAAGELGEAEWQAEELRALRPGFAARDWLQTNPTADEGLRAMLVERLGALGL